MAEPAITPSSATIQLNDVTLDLERLELLRSLCDDGDTSMIRELVDAWKGESAGRLTAIKTAIETNKLDSIKREGHALKGCCTNLGVNRLAEMSRLMEKDITSAEAAKTLFLEMLAEHAKAAAALDAAVAT